ncbi:Testis-expressed sequence 10 protein [Ceratobasidium sp. AG-Ba]|nr:Testis-expressed sequence 10 protein [Ceratobasidium sp. AG-Ba]
MPKSSKKRKEKAADFAKAKLKLGKGKKPASNEIDTSFKARSVALPSQTIRTEEHVAEQGVPTTRRRLTYDDLLVHLRHYSSSTRKDALQGLRELLSDNPTMVMPNLGSLLGAIAKLIADDDHSVRAALIKFLEWILEQTSTSALAPHAPPLLLFSAAALAHISASIRADAVQIIGILLEKIPRVVVSGAGLSAKNEEGPGARILEGLMVALGAGESKSVNTNISLTSTTKSTLLTTLDAFLRCALLDSSSTSDSISESLPTWYFASAFPSTSAFDSFVSTLASRNRVEENTVVLDSYDIISGPIGCDLDLLQADASESGPSTSKNGYESHNILASRLHPVLIATFLDNAPQLRLSPSSYSASVELVVKVAELANLVYGAVVRDGTPNKETLESLNTMLTHMSVYFPFGDVAGLGVGETVSMKTREATQSLNLAYCELVSLSVSRASQLERRPKRLGRPNKKRTIIGSETGGKQVAEVAAYVKKCLRGEVAFASGLASSLSPTAYMSLLPTLWALRLEQDIMSTALHHATSASGGSRATKRIAIEFVGRLVLLDSDPNAATSVGLKGDAVKEWALGLPRTLWEFGDKDLRGTEVILLILLRMNQRRLLDQETLGALRQRLIPFFMIDHATKGPLPGPWNKLPMYLQKLALELTSSLCDSGIENTASLMSAVERVAIEKQLAYWNSIRPTL